VPLDDRDPGDALLALHPAGPRLEAGTDTLLARARERSASAAARGALVGIAADVEEIEDAGIRFALRVAHQLERKLGAGAAAGRAGRDPFLPYDPALFVADLSATHVLLLAKFHVLPLQLLIVTRAFEPQESPLAPADFAALAACLAEVDGLAFYNSGPVAGASQPHRHLQLVPGPVGTRAERTPLDAIVAASGLRSRPGAVAALPFRHAAARVDWPWGAAAAGRLHALYRELLAVAGEGAPYNLLATRDWMLLVPRSRERFESISVNALGFAGALLAPSREAAARVRAVGPAAVLRAVGFPARAVELPA
jgi:ATP adenylyltransferase